MLNHPNDRLTAFLHDELEEVEARAIEEHLASCERCRTELAELRHTDALLAGMAGAGLTGAGLTGAGLTGAGWGAVEAPDALWRTIEKRLKEHHERQVRQRFWLAAAVAASLVLALGIGIHFGWEKHPNIEEMLDMATFLDALAAAPRQEDSREFALLPAGFNKVDPGDAARVAGLSRNGSPALPPGSQLYGGRLREIAGFQVSELIYGNDDGPYLLFMSPKAITLDFDERRRDPCPAVSPTCARIDAGALAVF